MTFKYGFHISLHTNRNHFDHFRPEGLQTAPQRGLRAPLAHPQQTPAAGVDLVDDGQEIVSPQAASPVNLVDSDGSDPAELPVLQAPLHKPLHRPEDRFPTGQEHTRRFPPTHPPRPTRQEGHHRAGQRTLAVAPRNVLDHHSMRGTFHSPRRVAKPGGDPPQGYELPTPLWQAVIAWRGFLTTPTAPRNPSMGLDGDVDPRLVPVAVQTYFPVDEAYEPLHEIEDGLNL
jgi:hypothetical protein